MQTAFCTYLQACQCRRPKSAHLSVPVQTPCVVCAPCLGKLCILHLTKEWLPTRSLRTKYGTRIAGVKKHWKILISQLPSSIIFLAVSGQAVPTAVRKAFG